MGNVGSDGESFICPFCTDKVKLSVSSSPAQGDSKKLASNSNYSHSAPGAQCIVVPTAPVPCQPSAQPIDPGQNPLSIDGNTALGAGCKFMCAKGGLLTVSSSAQSSAIHNGAAAALVVTAPEVSLLPILPREAANDNDTPAPNDNNKPSPNNNSNNEAVENKIVAENIANGHAYDKHILGQPYGRGSNRQVSREFPGSMRTRKQFQDHAEKVMNNKNTPKKISKDNRAVAYWDEEYGAIIIKNKAALEKSTMFQPKNCKLYFNTFN